MTDPQASRHVELKNEEENVTAVAEVTTEAGPEGTVRTSLYAKSEHVRPGDRTQLVDTVMDLPEVQASDRLEATVPFGDVESVERLRERTADAVLRAAGASTLLDANVARDHPGQPGEPLTDARRASEQPGERPPAEG
jgi:hypothetical protein